MMQVVARIEHTTDTYTEARTKTQTDTQTDTQMCAVLIHVVMYLKRLLQPGNDSQAILGRSHAGLVGTHCQHKARVGM